MIARYALVDIGYGTIDDITFADAVKAGAASFQYFYDVRSRKSVIVTLEGQDTGDAVQQPVLLDSKGPVPAEFDNGYVAFEDLPAEKRRLPGSGSGDEDDEDDLDDGPDEDGREEEELVYDEDEDRP